MARFDFIEDANVPCTNSNGHSWYAWSPVDEHHYTWFLYTRRCIWMGCLAVQRVEDVEPKGKLVLGYTEE